MENEIMKSNLAEAMFQIDLASAAIGQLFEDDGTPTEEAGTQHELANESIGKAYQAAQAAFSALGGTEEQFKEYCRRANERFAREAKETLADLQKRP
jgi:hypothetical protein